MHEIMIKILDKDYVDDLIVSLVRQGYEVYMNWDGDAVCFIIPDEEVQRTGEKQ